MTSKPVGEPHACATLRMRRVRLLRRRRVDARADATLLRAAFQVLRLGPFNFGLPRLADQLLDRWHKAVSPFCSLISSKRLVTSTSTARAPCRPGGRCGGIPRGSGRVTGPDHDHINTDFDAGTRMGPRPSAARIGGIAWGVNGKRKRRIRRETAPISWQAEPPGGQVIIEQFAQVPLERRSSLERFHAGFLRCPDRSPRLLPSRGRVCPKGPRRQCR